MTTTPQAREDALRQIADRLIGGVNNIKSHGGDHGLRVFILARAAELHALAQPLAPPNAGTVAVVSAEMRGRTKPVYACELIEWADRLDAAADAGTVDAVTDAIREALQEIEYWHADMLTDSHPRGSGWKRVHDKLAAALQSRPAPAARVDFHWKWCPMCGARYGVTACDDDPAYSCGYSPAPDAAPTGADAEFVENVKDVMRAWNNRVIESDEAMNKLKAAALRTLHTSPPQAAKPKTKTSPFSALSYITNDDELDAYVEAQIAERAAKPEADGGAMTISTFNNGVCDVTTFTLEDGKYEIRSADNGAVVVLRYGELWRDLTGDKLIGALLHALAAAPRAEGREDGEFEVWQDDMNVAGASGPGALTEAMHYAAQYAEDGPLRVERITRTVVYETSSEAPSATTSPAREGEE